MWPPDAKFARLRADDVEWMRYRHNAAMDPVYYRLIGTVMLGRGGVRW
jgi:hypothetical protein